MAILPNGINGHFVGRLGNFTGYVSNGKNIIRSRPRKSTAPMSPKRLAQQEKLKICGFFTKSLSGTGFFNKTFPAYGNNGSGFNRATSAVMNLAIVGTYPDISISYPLVLISKGPLPSPQNAAATSSSDGAILFQWTDNSGTGTARSNDKAVLVAYFPELQQAMYSLSAGSRSDGEAILHIGAMKEFAAETWMGFLSADEKDAANSVYTGRVETASAQNEKV